MTANQELSEILLSAIGLLNLDRTDSLRQEIETLCNQLEKPTFRIAVFAPFNYGKSTLLNAILGEKTLPIDLIPTTGAAICVRYGEILQTRIRLTSGQEIVEFGTEILKQFAILDDDRRMREDVISVEVSCPHPFLQNGIELIDLPGTNDREAQDALVKNQLLQADLIIQLLDGRKLMTLGEREQLRDWLLDRGINTVIFVVNFLNLLDSEEQKQVMNRLRFVAESFHAKLPDGISNLYRVDALPALRARLKGDINAAQTSGLPILETALQTIVTERQSLQKSCLSRAKVLAPQIEAKLQEQIQAFSAERNSEGTAAEIKTEATKIQQRLDIKQKAQRLIQQGFSASLLEFRDWLSWQNLCSLYQEEAAIALQRNVFRSWELGAFKQQAIDYQQALIHWVHQACEFFDQPRPTQLLITFPSSIPNEINEPQPELTNSNSDAPVAVATGLGWIFGGVVGAAVLGGASYLLNQTFNSRSERSESEQRQLYRSLAEDYLTHFSSVNLAALDRYETAANQILNLEIIAEPLEPTPQHYHLQLLQTTLERLTQVSC